MSNHFRILSTKDLTVGYKGIPVLEGINLKACSGEVIGIIGGNGSGKTTLLRTISGVIREIKGDILINQKCILHKSALERVKDLKLGYLLQHNRCIPDLTINENLHLAQWGAPSWSEREKKIKEILSRRPFNKLQAYINEYANVLSGGQELILALASLLLQNSEVILLDEPSDGLDESNRAIIVDTIQELKSPGRVIIVVEQLLRVLFTISDRVYLVKPSKMYSDKHDDTTLKRTRTLSELKLDRVKRIKEIYRQSPVLSVQQIEVLDSLLWDNADQPETV
jgi:branched-chain amino acid transport system ATP-binding protein